MVHREGFEPPTSRLSVERSTRLSYRCTAIGLWSPETDSNRRPADYKSAALPSKLSGLKININNRLRAISSMIFQLRLFFCKIPQIYLTSPAVLVQAIYIEFYSSQCVPQQYSRNHIPGNELLMESPTQVFRAPYRNKLAFYFLEIFGHPYCMSDSIYRA